MSPVSATLTTMTEPNDNPTTQAVAAALSGRTIHERITDIIADLPAVGKDRQMTTPGMRYDYRGIEDVVAAVKPLLAMHGVHVAADHTIAADDAYEAASNNKVTRWRHITLTSTFTFYGLAGDSFTVSTIGEGKDSADKAANKAMTAAWKYALLQAFAIADGDDPDHVAPPVERATATPPAPVERTPLDELLDLKPRLSAAGEYDNVKVWAAQAGIDLSRATPAEQVGKVVAYARSLLGDPT
jgi:hypothetical protein